MQCEERRWPVHMHPSRLGTFLFDSPESRPPEYVRNAGKLEPIGKTPEPGSRAPVADRGDLDNVVGVVHLRDIVTDGGTVR